MSFALSMLMTLLGAMTGPPVCEPAAAAAAAPADPASGPMCRGDVHDDPRCWDQGAPGAPARLAPSGHGEPLLLPTPRPVAGPDRARVTYAAASARAPRPGFPRRVERPPRLPSVP